jgi:hypothetical protein
MEPGFTPLWVLRNCPCEEISWADGWEITWDGPMMSPLEYWAPIAEKEGYVYCCTGEPGDDITSQTGWLLVIAPPVDNSA